MIEEEHIDDLFRNTLLHQEFPVDEDARNRVMKILDERKGKNVRVIYWISGLLGLLAIGVGLAFFFCRAENHTNDQNIETTSPSSLASSSPQHELADSSTNADNGSIKSNSTGLETTGQNDNHIAEANTSAPNAHETTDKNMAYTQDKGDVKSMKSNHVGKEQTRLNSFEEKLENQTGLSQSAPDKTRLQKQRTNDQSIQESNGSAKMVDEIDEAETMPSVVVQTEQAIPEAESIQTASPVTDIIRTDEIPTESNLRSDSVSLAENILDSTSTIEDLLKPDYKKPGFSKWDMRLAGSGLYTYSTIGQRNVYADVYAQQRNQQETSLSGYGFDVSLTRNNDRSFMSLGLGYLQTRQNIQYEATKTVLDITSEEYWEYESVLYMIVDGTGTNLNTVVWDTSFMEVNVDSTLFVTYDTITTTAENTAITAFNGAAKWSHLYLPLVYGIRLDHKTKSSLYAVGSVEFDYLTRSTAHYLTSDGQSVKPMTDFPGYRRFMINGSVGIEWRKLLGGERMYLLVNPGVRTNLYSWNADFKHSTVSPFVRAGIGWRLMEK